MILDFFSKDPGRPVTNAAEGGRGGASGGGRQRNEEMDKSCAYDVLLGKDRGGPSRERTNMGRASFSPAIQRPSPRSQAMYSASRSGFETLYLANRFTVAERAA